jgi:hypothetical protein
MTNDEIESRVHRVLVHLDGLLIRGKMSSDDYHKNIRDLNQWAEAKRLESQTRIYWALLAADEEWSRIGQAEFGKRWGDVRYTVAGNGEPGTALRQVYDAFVEARDARDALRRAYGRGRHQ